jgi:hypothetical protein
MLHILEWIFLRVQEVKGRDGSMANRNGIVDSKMSTICGLEYGIQVLGRKREETLALRKHAIMADNIYDCSDGSMANRNGVEH